MFQEDSLATITTTAMSTNATFTYQNSAKDAITLERQLSNNIAGCVPNSGDSNQMMLQYDSTCDASAILTTASCSSNSPMHHSDDGEKDSPKQKSLVGLPKPPKKPLTPYMGFSKAVWQQVKLCNPGMTVCQVGTTIGRLWRELSEEDRQKYNNFFHLDKTRYDTEMKAYLAETGLQPSDLVKPRAKRVKKSDGDTLKTKKSSQASNQAVVSTSAVGDFMGAPNTVGKQAQGESESTSHDTVTSGSYSLPHFAQLWNQPDGNGFTAAADKSDPAVSKAMTTSLTNEQQQLLLLQQIQLQQQLAQQQQQQEQQQTRQQGLVVYHIRPDGTPECFFQNTGGVFDFPSATTTNPQTSGDTQQQVAEDQSPVANQWSGPAALPGAPRIVVAQQDSTELTSLRSDLAEKCQEVNRLMEQLGEAYGLIRQLKQQNDFYHQHWSVLMQQQQHVVTQATPQICTEVSQS